MAHDPGAVYLSHSRDIWALNRRPARSARNPHRDRVVSSRRRRTGMWPVGRVVVDLFEVGQGQIREHVRSVDDLQHGQVSQWSHYMSVELQSSRPTNAPSSIARDGLAGSLG